MTETQQEKKSDMFKKIGGRENFNKLLYGLTKGVGGLALDAFTDLEI